MNLQITTIIKDFEFETIIGMFEFEQKTPQKVRINAEFCSESFVDYVEFKEFLKEKYNELKFQGVEESLSVMSKILKDKFQGLKSLKLEILKLEILKDALVGARLDVIY